MQNRPILGIPLGLALNNQRGGIVLIPPHVEKALNFTITEQPITYYTSQTVID